MSHDKLKYQRISVAEMILRATKRHFKACMQSASLRTLSAAVSHFLNCFLSSCSTPHPHLPPEENLKKKKSKKKKNSGSSSSSQIAWVSLSPVELWKRIRKEVKNHFGYEIDCESIEQVVEKYSIQRISLLRGMCKNTGVQVLLREYDFDNRKYPTFTEDDILNIFPVVKHLDPPATDANTLFDIAQGRLQAGHFGEAHDLMIEALNTYNQVYGPLHGDIVTCFRAVARLHYLAEDVAQAVSYQKKACIVSERVFGVDHPETITAYVHLALYCYSAGLTAISLKLMYRARYLALLVYGEGHPDLATFDTNIGLMLHSQREFELSLKFLTRALEVQQKFHGPNSIQTATSHHLVARAKCCVGDFRSALLSEKSAFLIHKKMFGEEDVRTKESSEYLKQMTHQAVKMQKTLNEISGKLAGRAIGPPPKTSVSKVSEEHYDRKILGVINRLEESTQITSPTKTEKKS